MPDEDGYPTEEELTKIETWGCVRSEDCYKLFAFIKSCWWAADWGWTDPGEDGVYNISTGGWSGNEDIIISMRKNYLFWAFCWEESRRGGHYKFKPRNVPNIEEAEKKLLKACEPKK